MANAYLLKGTTSKSVLAYVVESQGQYLAHARESHEPEEASAALVELQKAGVPPDIIFMLSGYDADELSELAAARWEEPVELEHIGVVEAEAE